MTLTGSAILDTMLVAGAYFVVLLVARAAINLWKGASRHDDPTE